MGLASKDFLQIWLLLKLLVFGYLKHIDRQSKWSHKPNLTAMGIY